MEAKIIITLVSDTSGVHMSVDSALDQEKTIQALEKLTELLKIGKKSCNELIDESPSLTS